MSIQKQRRKIKLLGTATVTSSDGTPVVVTPQADVADISTADGSDPATTQALANATKAKVNTILAALRDAGIFIVEE